MQLAVERPQGRELPRGLVAGGFTSQVEEAQRPQRACAMAAGRLAPRLELFVWTRIERL